MNTNSLESSSNKKSKQPEDNNPYVPLDEELERNQTVAKEATTPLVYAYFIVLGMNSNLFFYLILVTVHYFKHYFPRYPVSFLNLAAAKAAIFITLFVLKLTSYASYNSQIISGCVGYIACFITIVKISESSDESGQTYATVLALEFLGALFSFVYQAGAIRVASFYDKSVYSYYYASAVAAAVISAMLGIILVYGRYSLSTFIWTITGLATVIASACIIFQIAMSRTTFYIENVVNGKHQPVFSFQNLKEIYDNIRPHFWWMVLTNVLIGITYSSIFFEIGPSRINYGIWVNAANIGANLGEFMGRSIGDISQLDWIVTKLQWYPFLYNVVIIGVFLIDDQSIFDKFWIIFWVMMFLLLFRAGFCITHYIVSAVGHRKEPNTALLVNYGRELGIALGSIVSLLVVYTKGTGDLMNSH